MNKTIIAAFVGTSLFMTACSTTTNTDLAKDMASAQKIRDKASEEQQARQQKRMEKEVSLVPEWATATPPPDEEGVYAVGMGTSDNLRLSIRKANLDGEYGLARATNQMVSGSERSYSNDTNGRVNHEEYTGLIDSLVANVPIVGVKTVNQETKPINGSYSTFILMKLPYKELNRALQAREAESQDVKVKQSFAELYERLDKAEKNAAKASAPPALSQTITPQPTMAQTVPTTTSSIDIKPMPNPTAVLETLVPKTQPKLSEMVQ